MKNFNYILFIVQKLLFGHHCLGEVYFRESFVPNSTSTVTTQTACSVQYLVVYTHSTIKILS